MVEQHENNSMEGVRNSCNKSSNFPFNIRSLKFSQLLISKLPTRGGILWMFLWCIQQTSRPSAIQEHRNFVTKQMKFDQSLEPGMQLQCDDEGGDRNPWKNNIETILLPRILLYLANLLLKWLSDTLLSNDNSTLRLIPAPTTTTWRKEDELTEFDFYGINVAAACCTFSFSFAQNGQKNGTNKILGATYGVCTFWIPVDLQCKYLYLEMLFGQAAAHWSDWQTNNLWLCLANDIKMIIDKIRNLSAVAVVAATLQVKYAEMNAINLLVMRNLMILISLNRLANARWIR